MENTEAKKKCDLLTPEEAAVLLRVTSSTVLRKCAAGEWPHVRVSARCIRLSRAWVETLLAPITLGLASPAT
jgi:excisionase family DNA binding protein